MAGIRVSRKQHIINQAIKEEQRALREANKNPDKMWERILNGQQFESYNMKEI